MDIEKFIGQVSWRKNNLNESIPLPQYYLKNTVSPIRLIHNCSLQEDYYVIRSGMQTGDISSIKLLLINLKRTDFELSISHR